MIVLGLHHSIESGAALIVDDQLVGVVHEERFSRVKNHAGWPGHSIDYLLREAGVTLEDVDKVVYGVLEEARPSADIQRRLDERISEGLRENPSLEHKYRERLESEIAWNERHLGKLAEHLETLGLLDRLVTVDHHKSHAAGAYFCSPFDDCLVFTADGKGGFKTSTLWRARDRRLALLDWTTTFDSAGYFYGSITKALGFQQERHEGKITGLAAYGNAQRARHITDQMLTFKDGRIRGMLGDFYMPWFAEPKDMPRLYAEVAKHSREDVAAAAQATLEEVFCKWIAFGLEKSAAALPVNVALAGGIFANVKLNQRIREIEGVKNVFVYPSMGDGGIPLGGILAWLSEQDKPWKHAITNVACGPRADASEIPALLSGNPELKATPCPDPVDDMIRLFADRKPLGFVRGRMEFGPRALCNRSILYHARDATVNDWLNKALNRSEFMPFAPVTIEEMAPRCFAGWTHADAAADFMTMTYDCTAFFREQCPAAVHVDGTARPQIVRKSSDPFMHDILTRYLARTGEVALVNTSFNNHEEPIVCTATDAFRCLEQGNIRALWLDGTLVVNHQNV